MTLPLYPSPLYPSSPSPPPPLYPSPRSVPRWVFQGKSPPRALQNLGQFPFFQVRAFSRPGGPCPEAP